MNDATSEVTYPCPVCVGTGSMESSDSTDGSWWDCRTCKGTGRLADRRQRHPAEAENERLRELLRRIYPLIRRSAGRRRPNALATEIEKVAFDEEEW